MSHRPFFSILLVLCSLLSFAQTETATVSGRITDQQGALMSGARIAITNIETNVTSQQLTNKDGLYVVTALKPGRYRITVSSNGFRTVNLTNVILNVQDSISQNFKLQLGSVAESITVVADEAKVNTESATVSTVVNRNFAENLPMNGRSFQTLIDLTPGVVTVPSNGRDNGQFSVNGQRAASNYWTIDGVSANVGVSASGGNEVGNGFSGAVGSFSTLGGTNSLVSVDAMQEFRIQTSTFAPEFGRTPGAQISIVTRSGGNQFHGTAFDYFRNDALDANNWFNTAVTPALPKAKERQNDFGGTLSGPILHDKTFFFFSYEGLRLRLPTTELTTVPDINPADPFSRQFATQSMQPYLNIFPLPNGQEVLDSNGNHQGIAELNASYSNPASLDAYALRIDHKLRDGLSLFGRYSYSPSSLDVRGANGTALSIIQVNSITNQAATIGANWAISPRTDNDLRFNYSRTDSLSRYLQDSFGGAALLTSLPFPNSFNSSNGLFFIDIFPLQLGTIQLGHNGYILQQQTNLVDSLSIQTGAHNIKLGFDFRRLTPSSSLFQYALLTLFTDVPSYDQGSLLLSAVQHNLPVTFLFRNLGAYAQDTWRPTGRLTLTYGCRWDTDFTPKSQNGPSFAALKHVDLNNLSSVALAPLGTPAFSTTYGNVAPRVGMAYQLFQKLDWLTVVRSGFGVFYDLATSQAGGAVGSDYPFGSSSSSLGGTFPFSTPQPAPPVTPASVASGLLFAFVPNLKQPYTLEWNAAVEQALGREQTISFSYVGASGRHLLQSTDISQPNPSIRELLLVTNAGKSNYNAFQVQFERRLSKGLQGLASYTWAHSIDTGSAGSTAVASDVLVPGSPINASRGPSDFDIRNTLTAGITYEIPTRKSKGWFNAVAGGWSLDNFIFARSAPPVDVTDANFFELDSGVFADTRPDLVQGQALYLKGSQYPGGKAFNPAAFTNPPVDPNTGNPIRQGTTPRNFLRGFGAAQWDFAIHKSFPLRETVKLQFRCEMFNVLNHPNFGPPNRLFGFGGFGLSNQMLGQSLNGGSATSANLGNLGGGSLSPLYQLGGPRSIQLALKLSF